MRLFPNIKPKLNVHGILIISTSFQIYLSIGRYFQKVKLNKYKKNKLFKTDKLTKK